MEFKIPNHYKNHNPKIMQAVKEDIENDREFHYLFIGNGSVGKKDFANHIGSYMQNPVKIHALELFSKLQKAYVLYGNEKTECMVEVDRWKFANNLIVTDVGKELYLHKDAHKLMSAFFLYRSGFIRRDNTIYQGKYYGQVRTIITTDLGFRPSDVILNDEGKQVKRRAMDVITDTYGYDVMEVLYKSFKFMIFNNKKSISKETITIINDLDG